MSDFEAIVIGGGHAGIEASLALSREGFKTLLITQNIEAIGRMSCNPSIGGLAKGNLVREIDALGGEMAHLIDASMIQYRILNRSRGPAVQAPRAQADKALYSSIARKTLESERNLRIFMDTVVDLLIEDGLVRGVVTERGNRISSDVVVLTTGTFMEGRIFIGEYDGEYGRLGERAAIGLGTKLREYGFNVGRMKTGTPCRVNRDSIDFDELEEESGDETLQPFSFDYDSVDRPHLSCYITYTNEDTHRIIRENIKYSPLYGGKIVGRGPRYCPSIEDKVIRFPERPRHQIFVEPEGLYTNEMYLNGLSSSLPERVQIEFMRTIPGLRHVEVVRPAYAVEYDYLDPLDLYPTLESKILKNLFIAGQTNGTSGYEEAASQGLVAGINAAQRLKGAEGIVLGRTDSYIGVLIDDLTLKGTKEPYRMFTSRAEYRLKLRDGSADQRLTPIGRRAGLVGDEKYERLLDKLSKIDEMKDYLKRNRSKTQNKSLYDELKEPDVSIFSFDSLQSYSNEVKREVELEVKYEGYLKRQEIDIERVKRDESVKIDSDFDYDKVDGLSSESREKLKMVRPMTLGEASRISGLRVSDIALLQMALRGKRHD